MAKVLVFESDSALAAELKGDLEARGCEVKTVEDPAEGLAAASADKPDLILLTIELPKMNGFSVCNKLKRDKSLKGVPLILLSSDSTEETFEQHRRLRTRAEEYILKPIAFADLSKVIEKFVELTGGDDDEEEILIDDDIEFEDADIEEIDEEVEVIEEVEDEVDDEVDQFTEDAFDALLDDDSAESSAADQEEETSVGAGVAEEIEAAVLDEEAEDEIEMDEVEELKELEAEPESEAPAASTADAEAMASMPPSDAPPPPKVPKAPKAPNLSSAPPAGGSMRPGDARKLAQLEEQLAHTKASMEDLETQAKADSKALSAREAEVKKLNRDLDEAKANAAAAAKGGGTPKEFLDLREALNKKDKELLDQRDQLTHKDKELLTLRDGRLAADRIKADLDEKLLEVEKDLHEIETSLETSRADKEQAVKRGDDFKRKVEKLNSDVEAKAGELAEAKESAAQESATRDAKEASTRIEHQAALEKAAEDKETAIKAIKEAGAEAKANAVKEAEELAEADKADALKTAGEEAESAQATAVAERETELKKETDSKLAALHRANEDGMGKLKAEHEAALESLEAEIKERHEGVLKEHDDAHEATKADLTLTTETLDKVTSEKEEAEVSRDAKIASLEGELASAKQPASELEESLDSEKSKVRHAKTKWTDDQASLERAKDALAGALAQIEEAEARSIEA